MDCQVYASLSSRPSRSPLKSYLASLALVSQVLLFQYFLYVSHLVVRTSVTTCPLATPCGVVRAVTPFMTRLSSRILTSPVAYLPSHLSGSWALVFCLAPLAITQPFARRSPLPSRPQPLRARCYPASLTAACVRSICGATTPGRSSGLSSIGWLPTISTTWVTS